MRMSPLALLGTPMYGTPPGASRGGWISAFLIGQLNLAAAPVGVGPVC